jgi:hypothetical protein
MWGAAGAIQGVEVLLSSIKFDGAIEWGLLAAAFIILSAIARSILPFDIA